MVKKIKNCSKKNIIFLVLTIVMFLGISLASVYFLYFFNDQRENSLTTGLISIDFNEGTEVINLENTVPVLDEVGLQNTPYEFTVKNTSKIPINLKIQLEVQSETTIPLGAVKYAFYIDNELKIIDNIKTNEDGSLYIHTNFPTQKTVNCKLIFWVDYYYENPGETFSAKVKVTGESFDIIAPESGSETMLKAINSNTDESCNPIVEEDGIIYFSGDNECVDFNYVWYSGKLWRVTAIYPDGSMKMITEDSITTINWGEKATVSETDLTSAYPTSYIREWLNQEFLPTLYNYENIIDVDAGWYSITDSAASPTKPTGDYTLTDPVGLLNLYEYYTSFKNTSYENGYLNNGYWWWLITPYDSLRVSSVYVYGYLRNSFPSSGSYGVRPSVNLKSTIQLSGGSGTSEDPYRIKGDIEDAEANVTLINMRQSGEYVKLSSDETAPVFRIVDTELVGENLTTKIVLNDYVKESDTVLTKYFSGSSSHELWTEVSASDTTYWRGYLNTTWLGTLDTNMLEKGTYYLGYHTTGSYKTTVCSTVNSDVSVKGCINNGTVVSNISSDDYVGLLRVGEMFVNQTIDTYLKDSYTWLITPYSSSHVYYVYSCISLNYNDPSSNSHGVRPSINLKSTIVIKSGSGTKQDPFVVGLPN